MTNLMVGVLAYIIIALAVRPLKQTVKGLSGLAVFLRPIGLLAVAVSPCGTLLSVVSRRVAENPAD